MKQFEIQVLGWEAPVRVEGNSFSVGPEETLTVLGESAPVFVAVAGGWFWIMEVPDKLTADSESETEKARGG